MKEIWIVCIILIVATTIIFVVEIISMDFNRRIKHLNNRIDVLHELILLHHPVETIECLGKKE